MKIFRCRNNLGGGRWRRSGSVSGRNCKRRLSNGYGRRMERDNPIRPTRAYFCRTAPDSQLHITALQFELGDFFFFEELYKFLDLFEVHAFERLASSRFSRIASNQMRGSPCAHSGKIRLQSDPWSEL